MMNRNLRIRHTYPDGSVHANAALLVPERIAEVLAWEPAIDDPARVLELHQMRISAKRLRYTLEILAPYYGSRFARAIETVKRIQEQLGQIHDADVLVPELVAELRALVARSARRRAPEIDLDAVAGLVSTCRRLRAERAELHRRFLADWRGLRSDGFFEALRTMVHDRLDRTGRPHTEDGRHGFPRTGRRTAGVSPDRAADADPGAEAGDRGETEGGRLGHDAGPAAGDTG